jgi:hypothetical protein
LPINPWELRTLPPLEITRELPLPSRPTSIDELLLQSELLPVTSTELFEELA